MENPSSLRDWTSCDAAFALGVFSRDPGTDVLYDLAINDNLELSPNGRAALLTILSRINLEANMAERTKPAPWSDAPEPCKISWFDTDAIAVTCDVAIPRSDAQYGWYQLGLCYAEWFLLPSEDNLRQLEAAIASLPDIVSQSPIAKMLEFPCSDELPDADRVRDLLGSDAERDIKSMLVWDLVHAQGEWIRQHANAANTQSTSFDPVGSGPQVELLNKERVCELLGCTTRHIDKLVGSGRMPEPVYLGRIPRWRSDNMQKWLVANCPVVNEVKHRAWQNETEKAA